MPSQKQKPYSRQTAKFLAGIGENMPEISGAQMQAWIENPTLLQKALTTLDQPMIGGASQIVPWRTIIVGGMTTEQLIEELQKALGKYYAEEMVRVCPLISERHQVVLTKITPREMGFATRPNLYVLLRQAEKLALSHHAAIGPYLRLAYFDQPVGYDHQLFVPCELFPDEDGDIWYLDRVSEEGHPLFLGGSDVDEGAGVGNYRWDLDSPFIFILGKLEPIAS